MRAIDDGHAHSPRRGFRRATANHYLRRTENMLKRINALFIAAALLAGPAVLPTFAQDKMHDKDKMAGQDKMDSKDKMKGQDKMESKEKMEGQDKMDKKSKKSKKNKKGDKMEGDKMNEKKP